MAYRQEPWPWLSEAHLREWYRNSDAERIAAASRTESERNCAVVPTRARPASCLSRLDRKLPDANCANVSRTRVEIAGFPSLASACSDNDAGGCRTASATSELSGGEGAAAISLSGSIGRKPGWLVSMTTASGPFSSEVIRIGGSVECEFDELAWQGRGQQGIGCKEQHEQRSADPQKIIPQRDLRID